MDKRRVYRNIVVIAVALAFILIITMVIQFVMIGVESSRNAKLNEEISKLNIDITNISEEVEYKKTLMYVEKYARENLDLYGEGDVVFVPKK